MTSARAGERPNILLVIMDTTRAASLSCYGHSRATTPFLDRFAERSTLYTRAYSGASWTIPSHGTIFTGLPASLHGMYVGRHVPVPGATTFGDVLANEGYACHFISSNNLLFYLMQSFKGQSHPVYEQKPYLPANRFAIRWLKSEQSVLNDVNPLKPGGRFSELRQKLSRLRRRLAPGVHQTTGVPRGLYVLDDATHATRNCVRKAKQIFMRSAEEPFLVVMNLMQAHWAFNPPGTTKGHFGSFRSWDTLPDPEACYTLFHNYRNSDTKDALQQLETLYDEELLFQDRMIGNLLDALEQSGQRERTLVILTSDHGEALGDHEHVGHGCSLYDEAVRVPLIIRYPESCRMPGGPDSRLVSLQDLFATMMECAGLDSRNSHSYSLLKGADRPSAILQAPYEDYRMLLHRCETCAKTDPDQFWEKQAAEIGRASCRERV